MTLVNAIGMIKNDIKNMAFSYNEPIQKVDAFMDALPALLKSKLQAA